MPKFEIAELEPGPYAHLTRSAAMTGIAQAMGESFDVLGKAFATSGAAMAGPPLAHYLSFDQNSTTFEVGFPVLANDVAKLKAAGLEIGETPAGTVMKAIHVGPYDSMTATYSAMQEEMKARKLVPATDMWEIYMSPPETPPAEIRTEVIWPVTNPG